MENQFTTYSDADLFRLAGVRGLPDATAILTVDEASTIELVAEPGLPRRNAEKAKAILEIGKRWIRASTRRRHDILSNSKIAYEVLQPFLAHQYQESFVEVLLSAKHSILDIIEISRGTLTSSLVHPREVFRPAVKNAAAAVIVAHNHPSGDPKPSKEDRMLTERLGRAAEELGIQLLDHLILGESSYISFADEGWLAPNVHTTALAAP